MLKGGFTFQHLALVRAVVRLSPATARKVEPSTHGPERPWPAS